MKTDPNAMLARVADLLPWLDNPRVNQAAIPKVAESIRIFGFGSPIIIRRANNEIIAGHTRLAAAIFLGLDEVPVRILDLTAEQAHALAVADNKLGELAAWDDEKLALVIGALPSDLLAVTGISTEEADRILAGIGTTPGAGDAAVGDLPDGKPQVDPKDAVTEILAEVRIPTAVSKAFLDELRALVARHPGVVLGIA